MTVRIDVSYDGDLHCRAVHGPSGDVLLTDAPADNGGKGEHFSPTDLVGTAMATCMLTIMGLAAKRRHLDLSGTTASVEKEMGAEPRRHIKRLTVRIALPPHVDAGEREILAAAARTCPVAASLGPLTTVDLQIA